MLVKSFQRVVVRGVPEVKAVPATTVCTPAPPTGYWQQSQYTIVFRIPEDGNGFQIPPGASVSYQYNGPGNTLSAIICTVVSYRWVSTGASGPPTCTLYPAVEYAPAVIARDEMVPTAGWDSGANSVQARAEGCEAKWVMNTVAGVYVGLTDELENVDDTSRYPHSFYFHQSAGKPLVRIVESGKTRSHDRQYVNGDEFIIRRLGGRVTYWHAGELVYTSLESLEVEVNVGASLYASGDMIPGGGGGAPPASGWVKIGPAGFAYSLNASEFGGMTELADGSASFVDFNASMSAYMWKLYIGSNEAASPHRMRVVFTPQAGSAVLSEALLSWGAAGGDPNNLFLWGSGIEAFDEEIELSDDGEVRFSVSGDFTNFSGLFEFYVFVGSP